MEVNHKKNDQVFFFIQGNLGKKIHLDDKILTKIDLYLLFKENFFEFF